MSSFFDSAIQSFGPAASIGASGASQAASDTRHERLTRELQAQANKQREEEKLLAAELRKNQEKKDTLGLFFRASGSDNPDELAAAASHFSRLAASDPVQWGTHATELTTLAADAKAKRAKADLLKAEQIKTAAEEQTTALEFAKGQLAAQKRAAALATDPDQLEITAAQHAFDANPHAPGVAASLLTPPQVPYDWSPKKGRFFDALNAEQTNQNFITAAILAGRASGTRRTSGGSAAAEKSPGQWTIELDSEGHQTKTWKGTELPPGTEAIAAPLTPISSLLPKDEAGDSHRKNIAEITDNLGKLQQKRWMPGRVPEPDDQKKLQDEVLPLLSDLTARLNLAARLAADGDPAKETALLAQVPQEVGRYAAKFDIRPAPKPAPKPPAYGPAEDPNPQPKPKPTAPAPVVRESRTTAAAAAPPVATATPPAAPSPALLEAHRAQAAADWPPADMTRPWTFTPEQKDHARKLKEMADEEKWNPVVNFATEMGAEGLRLVKQTAVMAARIIHDDTASTIEKKKARESIRQSFIANGVTPTEAQIDAMIKPQK